MTHYGSVWSESDYSIFISNLRVDFNTFLRCKDKARVLVLPYLSSEKRYRIHNLTETEYSSVLKSFSVGKGFDRRVVIAPIDLEVKNMNEEKQRDRRKSGQQAYYVPPALRKSRARNNPIPEREQTSADPYRAREYSISTSGNTSGSTSGNTSGSTSGSTSGNTSGNASGSTSGASPQGTKMPSVCQHGLINSHEVQKRYYRQYSPRENIKIWTPNTTGSKKTEKLCENSGLLFEKLNTTAIYTRRGYNYNVPSSLTNNYRQRGKFPPYSLRNTSVGSRYYDEKKYETTCTSKPSTTSAEPNKELLVPSEELSTHFQMPDNTMEFPVSLEVPKELDIPLPTIEKDVERVELSEVRTELEVSASIVINDTELLISSEEGESSQQMIDINSEMNVQSEVSKEPETHIKVTDNPIDFPVPLEGSKELETHIKMTGNSIEFPVPSEVPKELDSPLSTVQHDEEIATPSEVLPESEIVLSTANNDTEFLVSSEKSKEEGSSSQAIAVDLVMIVLSDVFKELDINAGGNDIEVPKESEVPLPTIESSRENSVPSEVPDTIKNNCVQLHILSEMPDESESSLQTDAIDPELIVKGKVSKEFEAHITPNHDAELPVFSAVTTDLETDHDHELINQNGKENKDNQTFNKAKDVFNSISDKYDVKKRADNVLATSNSKVPETSKVKRVANASPNPSKEEMDWEELYDDDGNCLEPQFEKELTRIVGKVRVCKPTNFDKDLLVMDSEVESTIEIYNIPPEYKIQDLIALFNPFITKRVHIKWVDDTHALAIFPSPYIAKEAISADLGQVKTRPLRFGTCASREKAKALSLPSSLRPKTCPLLARRLVSGALGLRDSSSKETKEAERQTLKIARDEKKLAAQQREAAWEGTLGKS